MSTILPATVVNNIQRVEVDQQRKDWAFWTVDNNGRFSTTWQQLRSFKNEILPDKALWHRKMPSKISFHVQRVLKNQVSTDEGVHKYGVKISSRCNCCKKYQRESCSHLFGSRDSGGSFNL